MDTSNPPSGHLTLSEFTYAAMQLDETMDETTAERLFEHMCCTVEDDLLFPEAFESWMAVPGMRKPDHLLSPASADDDIIEVHGEAKAGFKVNDKIRLIGKGGAEEVVTVKGFEDWYPHQLAIVPHLEYSYEAGSRIEFVESTTTKRTTTTFTTSTVTTTTITTTTGKDPAIQIKMTIDKGDGTEPLGLDTGKGDGFVLVNGVTGGVIQQWNEDNPEHALKPGDRIVEVNGVRNHAAQIEEEIVNVKSNKLVLVIKRNPPKAEPGPKRTPRPRPRDAD
jgi:hypothetical protein